MTETFYDVLGVPDDASDAAIRDAYRERVKETHPDVSDHPDAEERFKRVKRAEEVLGDAEERTAYDRLGHAAYVDDDRSPEEPDVGSVDDEVRAAAARAADADHDAGGRSAAWRERERRANRRGRDFWADYFDGFADDSRSTDRVDLGGVSDPTVGNARAADRRAGSAADPGDAGDPDARRGSGVRAGESDVAATGATSGGPRGDGPFTAAAAGSRTGHHPAGATADGWGSETTANHVYSVQDWGEQRSGLRISMPDWTQNDAVFLAATLFLYPIMLFATALPSFPVVANVAIGLLTISYVAFLLPRPSFAIPVFGTWSLLAPAFLLGLDVPFLSLVGIVVLAGVWLPLAYSVAVALVLIR